MTFQQRKDKEDAIRILQSKATEVARTGGGSSEASFALTILHNAAYYLITGHAWYQR